MVAAFFWKTIHTFGLPTPEQVLTLLPHLSASHTDHPSVCSLTFSLFLGFWSFLDTSGPAVVPYPALSVTVALPQSFVVFGLCVVGKGATY